MVLVGVAVLAGSGRRPATAAASSSQSRCEFAVDAAAGSVVQERVRPKRPGRQADRRAPPRRIEPPRVNPGRATPGEAEGRGADRIAGRDARLAGFERLRTRLGAQAPTGRGAIVAIVEGVDANDGYRPDTSLPEFAGIEFIDHRSVDGGSGRTAAPSPAQASAHATMVGRRFFGGAATAASGVSEVHVLGASDFLRDAWLRLGTREQPRVIGGVSIVSHAWVGSSGDGNAEALARADIVALRDGVLWVAGVANRGSVSPPLMASGWNVLGVGTMSAGHAGSERRPEAGVGGDRPFIVAPGGTTSEAVPVVAAAAAVLHEAAGQVSDESLVPVARRPEVLIASLLAGARGQNRYSGRWSNVDAVIVRTPGVTQTASTPLDPAVGAGVLDVDGAHRVLMGHPTGQAGRASGWTIGHAGPETAAELVVDEPAIITAAAVQFRLPRPDDGQAVRVRLERVDEPASGDPGAVPDAAVATEALAVTEFQGTAGMVRLRVGPGRYRVSLSQVERMEVGEDASGEARRPFVLAWHVSAAPGDG